MFTFLNEYNQIAVQSIEADNILKKNLISENIRLFAKQLLENYSVSAVDAVCVEHLKEQYEKYNAINLLTCHEDKERDEHLEKIINDAQQLLIQKTRYENFFRDFEQIKKSLRVIILNDSSKLDENTLLIDKAEECIHQILYVENPEDVLDFIIMQCVMKIMLNLSTSHLLENQAKIIFLSQLNDIYSFFSKYRQDINLKSIELLTPVHHEDFFKTQSIMLFFNHMISASFNLISSSIFLQTISYFIGGLSLNYIYQSLFSINLNGWYERFFS
ncbi:hypothetical protein AB837_00002 [bacterium AB1]|nr:hypothetical protein AB837_00002 [bacterium AB1]